MPPANRGKQQEPAAPGSKRKSAAADDLFGSADTLDAPNCSGFDLDELDDGDDDGALLLTRSPDRTQRTAMHATPQCSPKNEYVFLSLPSAGEPAERGRA